MNNYPGWGKGVASLVLGILALIFAWFGWGAIASIVMAIVGIVLGVNSRKEGSAAGAPTGMATAGLACSVVALVLSAVVFVACVLCVSCAALLG